ncbi:Uncharacterised protein [Shewanella algae]|uniref:Uncharacterized protein n=1 Tax=Shewanella algae TaxID=38313 RepID=A0A380BKS4_9GAMM|nr:Uncharacterised protein [Shewanella algae]
MSRDQNFQQPGRGPAAGIILGLPDFEAALQEQAFELDKILYFIVAPFHQSHLPQSVQHRLFLTLIDLVLMGSRQAPLFGERSDDLPWGIDAQGTVLLLKLYGFALVTCYKYHPLAPGSIDTDRDLVLQLTGQHSSNIIGLGQTVVHLATIQRPSVQTGIESADIAFDIDDIHAPLADHQSIHLHRLPGLSRDLNIGQQQIIFG